MVSAGKWLYHSSYLAAGCAMNAPGQLTVPDWSPAAGGDAKFSAGSWTIRVVVGKLAVPWLSLGSLVCLMCCWAAGCNMVIVRQLTVHACW
jgi:hypothetical protein